MKPHSTIRTGAILSPISIGVTIAVSFGGAMVLALAIPRSVHVAGRGRAPVPARVVGAAVVRYAVAHDTSGPLVAPGTGQAGRPVGDGVRDIGVHADSDSGDPLPAHALAARMQQDSGSLQGPLPVPPAGLKIEQTSPGTRPSAMLVAEFDGLGEGFVGPQGSAVLRNPSDNSLAVGRDHIMQIVNTRVAIYTKKGATFDTTGRVLYGPVETRNFFRGFGGACEAHNNGDAVVRYDQLADRWLIVMPIFSRSPQRPVEPEPGRAGEPARESERAHPGQPGRPEQLFQPAPPPPVAADSGGRAGRGGRSATRPPPEKGSYAMCYAVSTGPDPFGPYYRYEFTRPLFPDYPRPAIWPDGYYVPSSTGDDVIQKHACVADRMRMLNGQDASEQCVIVDGVNFLNNADVDGRAAPPPGAPNIMMAAGGTQLEKKMEDSALYAWSFHVDWTNPSKTTVMGPQRIAVAPYHYLCDGQLSSCVSQPGTDRRLDAQGDKLMTRLAYRRIGNRESIVAVHSVNTSKGGGVRWYELRVEGKARALSLVQEGTYALDGFRWMGSAAMDAKGDIGIGFSFGGAPNFPGQRFAARLAGDAKGMLTLREAVLADGEAAQTNTLRWEDYTATAVDPSDDCTIWYVGDYLRRGAANYSTRIGGYRLPGCR